jgi:hypothetical protein
MDVLLGLAGLVVLISVPVILGLIYLELRQRRLFGPRSIITEAGGNFTNDTAAIAMSLQAELERLRADVHGALTGVSTDIERVTEYLNREPVQVAQPQPQAPLVIEAPRTDPERNTAISELYAALAKLDVAFLAVASPVLLPGEEFDPADDIPTEAFLWESWNDVGAAAFNFAEVFSQRRISLDPTTRDRLNGSLKSIRRCLTQQIYPALTDVDGSIPEENRQLVGQVIATLASDIRDARIVLEHAVGERTAS